MWISIPHGEGEGWRCATDEAETLTESCAGNGRVVGHPQVGIMNSKTPADSLIHCGHTANSLCQAAVAWSLGPHLHVPACPRSSPMTPRGNSCLLCGYQGAGLDLAESRAEAEHQESQAWNILPQREQTIVTQGTFGVYVLDPWLLFPSLLLHPSLLLSCAKNPAYKFLPHYQEGISKLCPKDKGRLPIP